MPGLPLNFCWFSDWALYTKGRKRWKEAGHSRLAGGRFKQQGNLSASFIWATARQISGPPTRILKVYIKSLTVSTIKAPQQHMLSQCGILECESHYGVNISRREEGEASHCTKPDPRSIRSHVLLMSSSKFSFGFVRQICCSHWESWPKLPSLWLLQRKFVYTFRWSMLTSFSQQM